MYDNQNEELYSNGKYASKIRSLNMKSEAINIFHLNVKTNSDRCTYLLTNSVCASTNLCQGIFHHKMTS